MSFVLDASIAACWCFPDEQSAVADTAMQRLLEDEALVPALWPLEIRNILVVSERRGRIETADADAFLRDLDRLPIRVRHDTDLRALVALARKHQLTSYDAAYLDLAMRTSATLATLDGSLVRAALEEGVKLIAE